MKKNLRLLLNFKNGIEMQKINAKNRDVIKRVCLGEGVLGRGWKEREVGRRKMGRLEWEGWKVGR